MKPASPAHDGHDEAARLLPWWVNGTLAPADAQHVELHLKSCAACRSDAAALAQLRAVMRSPDPVEHAPHGGLHKLMQRIDGLAAGAPSAPPAAAPLRRPSAGLVRWLAGAVVLQSAALAVVGTAALRSQERDEGAYRTLTAAPSSPAGAALRVVFAPGLTLSEWQGLLREQGLRVVAGPSDAGLFTLALQDGHSQAAVLARLRADTRVRFAEPLDLPAARP